VAKLCVFSRFVVLLPCTKERSEPVPALVPGPLPCVLVDMEKLRNPLQKYVSHVLLPHAFVPQGHDSNDASAVVVTCCLETLSRRS
jgi:hypothetical protein